jgi:Mismatch repair ATPase (MutS family)
VKRDVVRLVTPGTLTEDALLDARAPNHLAALAEIRGEAALAWLDLSTGELAAAPATRRDLGPLLARVAPREALAPEALADDPETRALMEEAGAVVTPLAPSSFDSAEGAARLRRMLGVATLDGFGAFTRPELAALGALADYVELTQKGAAPLLRPPRREAAQAAMRIDAATRRNLELTESLSGGREGSLLHAIDRTVTGAGARLLARRLAAPLTDPAAIAARLDAVGFFAEEAALREDVRRTLRRAPDAARALSRLALGRGGGRATSPRSATR